jgi:hypothetical protein
VDKVYSGTGIVYQCRKIHQKRIGNGIQDLIGVACKVGKLAGKLTIKGFIN